MMGFPGLNTLQDLQVLAAILSRLARRQWRGEELTVYRRRWLLYQEIFKEQPWNVNVSVLVARLFDQWNVHKRGSTPDLLLVVRAMVEAIPMRWMAVVGFGTMLYLDHKAVHFWQGEWRVDGVKAVVASLGWRLPGGGHFIPLEGPAEGGGLSVKTATTLQLAPNYRAQGSAKKEYITCALAEGATEPPEAEEVEAVHKTLTAAMQQLWPVPCDNQRKETLWRLVVNGVAGAGGHDVCSSENCPCGWNPGGHTVGGGGQSGTMGEQPGGDGGNPGEGRGGEQTGEMGEEGNGDDLARGEGRRLGASADYELLPEELISLQADVG
jgi:hypothetical protein